MPAPIRPRPNHPGPRPTATTQQPGGKPGDEKTGGEKTEGEYPGKGEYTSKPGGEQPGEQPGGKRNLGDVWKQLAQELIAGNADVVASTLNLDGETMREVLYAVADGFGGDQPQ